MLQKLRHMIRRGRELAAKGQLADAITARARSWIAARRFSAQAQKGLIYKEYSATLPDGLTAKKITLRLSVPPVPARPIYWFSEHVQTATGEMTDTVLVCGTGGFAISQDLGKTWRRVKIRARRGQKLIHVKSIGESEYLVQIIRPGTEGSKTAPVDMLVVDDKGRVLAEHLSVGHRWHGCRAVDFRDGTLMYAEYANNIPVNGRRPSTCRVMRSRDRGRSWQPVFERGPEQIRHFHFLQSRPGVPREWWLTAGDLPHECRIWRSTDDGDSWSDLTPANDIALKFAHTDFTQSIFRLTDLVWEDDEIIWATDDNLASVDPPGARVFRSRIGPVLKPELVGTGKWHFRNIVDLGDFYLLTAQRSNERNPAPEDRKPGVYIMPKKPVPGVPSLIFLFNPDSYPSRATAGFTFSKASRGIKGDTFFTFRSSEDVFPAGHRILEWKVILE